MIQQNRHWFLGIRSSLAARCRRRPPSTALTSFLAPNWKNRRSPSASARRLVDRAAQLVAHRLHGALRPGAAFTDARARQAARAEALDELLELVELGARQRLGLRGGQPPAFDDAAGRLQRRLQQADAAAVVARDRFREVDVRQVEAQVRLVVAVLAHRLGERQALERAGDLDPQHVLPERDHQPFDRLLDVVLVDERHLDVDLRELGLAIEAQILVAEAAHDLEVAVEARHHEQLLEELGRSASA